MKKILVILIVFSFLLIGNKAIAVFYVTGMSPQSFCEVNGGVYKNNSCYYVCEKEGSTQNFSSKNEAYNQCMLEKAKEIKQKVYDKREQELLPCKDFFEVVGVNLTLDTEEEQYNQWIKELKEAKDDYFKEQENQQKIKELEERINTLESKPIIVEKVIIPTEGINTHNKEDVIKPTINDNKIEKPFIKKEELKKEIVEEKPSTIIETTTTTETPIIPTNKSFFQRVFGWFKSLL
ncbi:MAG: hypothetical protein PHS54_03415 [Clostridia bacterium]|nr:hypothetical protein [Clostridia bacterium]